MSADKPENLAGTEIHDRPVVRGIFTTLERCIGIVLAISITGVAISFLLFGGCVDDLRKLIQ